jgi:hypothetical protein
MGWPELIERHKCMKLQADKLISKIGLEYLFGIAYK